MQRSLEALGGVIMVVYTGKVAAGALWATLGWGLSFVGGKPAELIERADADLLSAFLVGLLGMTIVEGAIIYIRRVFREKAS